MKLHSRINESVKLIIIANDWPIDSVPRLPARSVFVLTPDEVVRISSGHFTRKWVSGMSSPWILSEDEGIYRPPEYIQGPPTYTPPSLLTALHAYVINFRPWGSSQPRERHRNDIDDINLSLVTTLDWMPDMPANSPNIMLKKRPRHIVEFVDQGILKWLMEPEHPIFVYLRLMSCILLVNLNKCMIFEDVTSFELIRKDTYVIGFIQCGDDYACQEKTFFTRYPCYNKLRDRNCVQIATVGRGSSVNEEISKVVGKLSENLHKDINVDVITSAWSNPALPGNRPTMHPRIQLLNSP
ncbi:hypothetical protein Btru_021665 [Bulinus truncatus]|nr:hypothetical protein Btru_021665 [Bulinus truncatus]